LTQARDHAAPAHRAGILLSPLSPLDRDRLALSVERPLVTRRAKVELRGRVLFTSHLLSHRPEPSKLSIALWAFPACPSFEGIALWPDYRRFGATGKLTGEQACAAR